MVSIIVGAIIPATSPAFLDCACGSLRTAPVLHAGTDGLNALFAALVVHIGIAPFWSEVLLEVATS